MVSPEESIYQAAVLRFRPIMMTTMAALWERFAGAGTSTGAEIGPLDTPSSAAYCCRNS